MKVEIRVDDVSLGTVTVSAEALEAVRLKFNPSGLVQVNALKIAAALLYQLNTDTVSAMPEAGREAAVAKTHVQTASMWGVLAATKGL